MLLHDAERPAVPEASRHIEPAPRRYVSALATRVWRSSPEREANARAKLLSCAAS